MFLITGATGGVGREAVHLLARAGAEVTAVTRDPSAAAPVDGVRFVRPAEALSLDGIEGALISPRAAGPDLGALLARARDRVVLLSALTVASPAGEPRFRAGFEAAEHAVTAAARTWTILRGADYAANTLAWAGQLTATGTVRGAYALARTSTVDERDIAAVAVLALTTPGHAGRHYTLTGPESLSQPEKVAVIGAATGRDLTFTEVGPEAVRRGMRAAGLPDEIPDRLLGSLADYARAAGPTTGTVRDLLGRPARTYAEWAIAHRAAFAGNS
ncbi:NAD-dependent epimerase/dehydratase family protein [Catenuloplanes japonicus]|uniref:NAD-dependent epimerase/dehydratase family protein n=1 Tax=Catenuloplanes japonicus TaxID=33876 RepID=UPI00052668DE|nr:NAD-dependent epimerase/dehydratase family protein [Catenuloplanes japonicus]